MAYTGSYSLPAIGGRTFSRTAFNDQQVGQEFLKAAQLSGAATPMGQLQGISAGQYFTGEGGTEYRTVAGIDPNQPGWGSRVPTGYELIGYQRGSGDIDIGDSGRSRPGTPGFAILRKKAPAPDPVVDDVVDDVVEDVIDTNATTADTNIKEGEETLNKADLLKEIFDGIDERNKIQRELIAEANRTFAANTARSQMTPNLQIQPAGQTPDIAGTQGFKIRKTGSALGAAGTVLAGLNLGQPNAMNV